MFFRVFSQSWDACLFGPVLGGASRAHLCASSCPVVLASQITDTLPVSYR